MINDHQNTNDDSLAASLPQNFWEFYWEVGDIAKDFSTLDLCCLSQVNRVFHEALADYASQRIEKIKKQYAEGEGALHDAYREDIKRAARQSLLSPDKINDFKFYANQFPRLIITTDFLLDAIQHHQEKVIRFLFASSALSSIEHWFSSVYDKAIEANYLTDIQALLRDYIASKKCNALIRFIETQIEISMDESPRKMLFLLAIAKPIQDKMSQDILKAAYAATGDVGALSSLFQNDRYQIEKTSLPLIVLAASHHQSDVVQFLLDRCDFIRSQVSYGAYSSYSEKECDDQSYAIIALYRVFFSLGTQAEYNNEKILESFFDKQFVSIEEMFNYPERTGLLKDQLTLLIQTPFFKKKFLSEIETLSLCFVHQGKEAARYLRVLYQSLLDEEKAFIKQITNKKKNKKKAQFVMNKLDTFFYGGFFIHCSEKIFDVLKCLLQVNLEQALGRKLLILYRHVDQLGAVSHLNMVSYHGYPSFWQCNEGNLLKQWIHVYEQSYHENDAQNNVSVVKPKR